MLTRNCPSCGMEQRYKSQVYFNRVVATNGVCHSCSKKVRPYNQVAVEVEQQALALFQAGCNDREVSRRLGLSKSTVAGVRRRLGLSPRGRVLFKLKIENGKAVCKSCGNFRFESEFVLRPTKAGMQQSPTCKFCEYERTNQRLSGSIEAYMKHKVSTLKSLAKRAGLPFDLTAAYLVRLFEHQARKCFYTGQELKTERGKGHSKQSLSVDKIVPEAGYTRENVVLCTYKANVVKNCLSLEEIKEWLPGWYQQIEKRRESQCWLTI